MSSRLHYEKNTPFGASETCSFVRFPRRVQNGFRHPIITIGHNGCIITNKSWLCKYNDKYFVFWELLLKIPPMAGILLVRNFRFGHNDVFTQFLVVFTKFHFTSCIFRLGIFCCDIEDASFWITQLYNFFATFFRCHFIRLLLFLRRILGYFLHKIKSFFDYSMWSGVLSATAA